MRAALPSSSLPMDLDGLIALLLPRLRDRPAAHPALPVHRHALSIAAEFTASSSAPHAAPELAVALVEAMSPQHADPKWVRNPVSGVVHKVLVGPTCASPPEFVAYCGWRFGLGTFECLHDLTDVTYKAMCVRCLPERRLEAKALLVAAVAPA